MVSLALEIVGRDALAAGTVSASSLDSRCPALEIPKPSFAASHWKWSGIFPIYGGWIPDPHVVCFPVESRQTSGDTGQLKIQLAFLNPFWNDDTSEVLLIVDDGGEVHAIAIETPIAREIHGWVEDGDSHIRLLEANGHVNVLFGGKVRGLLALRMPLDSTAKLFLPGSPEFRSALTTLSQSEHADRYLQSICEREHEPFLTLAHVWFGGCPGLDYRARWNQDPAHMYELQWLDSP